MCRYNYLYNCANQNINIPAMQTVDWMTREIGIITDYVVGKLLFCDVNSPIDCDATTKDMVYTLIRAIHIYIPIDQVTCDTLTHIHTHTHTYTQTYTHNTHTHTLRWSEIYVFSKIDIDWLRLIRGSTYKYKSQVFFKTNTCKVLRYHLEV